MMFISGAKAPVQFERLAARLKPCPDTCFAVDIFTAAAKAVLIEAETAGINACSTPRGTQQMGMRKGINACSTSRGTQFSGAKAQSLERPYAALKGHSSTVSCPSLMGGRDLPQRLKPVLSQAGTAGINACSTPRGTQFSGAKAQI